jgi:hypothetical protein
LSRDGFTYRLGFHHFARCELLSLAIVQGIVEVFKERLLLVFYARALLEREVSRFDVGCRGIFEVVGNRAVKRFRLLRGRGNRREMLLRAGRFDFRG